MAEAGYNMQVDRTIKHWIASVRIVFRLSSRNQDADLILDTIYLIITDHWSK